jgi:hypothetical protein
MEKAQCQKYVRSVANFGISEGDRAIFMNFPMWQ